MPQIELLGRPVRANTKCEPSCVRRSGPKKGKLAKGCMWARKVMKSARKGCAVRVAGGYKTAYGNLRKKTTKRKTTRRAARR